MQRTDISQRNRLIVDGALSGKGRQELADEVGVSYSIIVTTLLKAGVKAPNRPRTAGAFKRNAERTENFKSMYLAGLTLEQIGERHGITRERVRQVLAKIGITRFDGGASKKAQHRKATKSRHRGSRYGITAEQWQFLSDLGVLDAWREQRRNAINRGIAWELTVSQFWSLWEQSGKWSQRGRKKGQYVLARLKDEGAYTLFNCWVCLGADNIREARAHSKRRLGDNIYCQYPGCKKPWVAKYSNRSIGHFATREEAVAAKAAFVAASSVGHTGGARGWYRRAGVHTKPYVAYFRVKNVGSFATEGEARSAHLLARWAYQGRYVPALSFVDSVQ